MPDNTQDLVALTQFLENSSSVTVVNLQTAVDEAAERLLFLLDYATLPCMYNMKSCIYWQWICLSYCISPFSSEAAGQTDSQVNPNFRLAFNLHFVWPPTRVDFGRAQIRSQVDARFSPFGRPMQVPDTSWSQVICIRVKFVTFVTCLNFRADLRIRLATHRKSVRKFWFCKLVLTCESIWPAAWL